MTSDQIMRTIYIVLWLLLIASGLTLRRMPRGKMASLAAIWLAIILCLWALITSVQKML
jgi:predicted aspartyl protease